MANIKSAKKKAKQSERKRVINLSRKTAIKTSIKKVQSAIAQKANYESIQSLIKEVASKLARAKNKGVLHKNTASRKLSKLVKQVNKVYGSVSAEKASAK